MKKIIVIGAGFSGLSAATCLAHAGYDVTVLEKNSTPGGRARQLHIDGFTFDMGPSWYWMPDVFENYFARFGRRVDQYYRLRRLNPSYRVFFSDTEHLDLPAGEDALFKLFDEVENGAGPQLRQFLKEAKTKYDVAMGDFIFKPGVSWREFARLSLVKSAMQLHLFRSIRDHVRKYFRDPRLVRVLEFPALFLGASPASTPALYSLMNHADMSLGTWYPEGGLYSVVKGMVKLAAEMGVEFIYDAPVKGLQIDKGKITRVRTTRDGHGCDAVIASADYHHVEQQLLPKEYQTYDAAYWDNRILAPSSLIFYIGLKKRVDKLLHHTLFFDTDFDLHAKEIYEEPRWPSAPQFYVSSPTVTDESTAPQDCHAIVVLIPLAPGLTDTEAVREKYFELMVDRIEKITGQSLRSNILVKKSYAINDFANDYNAFKGNAYGLANTRMQTAVMKPSMVSKKVANLIYCGQLTVPGPGVPTAVISGQIAARELSGRLQD